MHKFDLPYLGSFQEERKFDCENPLEEVWAQVTRFGTKAFLQRSAPQKNDIDWERYLRYVEIRVRQAVEFRGAARHATLLTSPLPLYYSFLNLTRAFLAFGPEIYPKPVHGLRFIGADNLVDSKARLTSGTFTDYLDSCSIAWSEGDEITLGETLGFVVELADSLYGQVDQHQCMVQAVVIKAMMGGEVQLAFPGFKGSFADEWGKAFPDLVTTCSLLDAKTLLVNNKDLGREANDVRSFAKTHLHVPLIFQSHPTWYKFRQDHAALKLNRAAYYYIAMFILGSVVRYEPELMLNASTPDSEFGWFLKRFLALAERFFPQLKLIEIYGAELYF